MHNLRKNIKYGGVTVKTEKTCFPQSTSNSCISHFIKERNFLRIPTPPDGNCFYHTITKFLELSGNTVLNSDYHLELRNTVVNKMEDNINELANSIILNDNNTHTNRVLIKKVAKLEELHKNGIWNEDTADIVPQYTAKALNIHIIIYDVKAAVKKHKVPLSVNKNGTKKYKNISAQPVRIISYTFEPDIDRDITINMLRIADGHYELLYPKDISNKQHKKKTTNKTHKNKINTLSNNFFNKLALSNI